MTDRVKSRTFRFSLRTLFIVMTVVGCWLGYQLRWMQQRHAYLEGARQEFRAHGIGDGVIVASDRVQAPGGTWLLGEQGIEAMMVIFDKGQLEAELARVKRLFPETDVPAVIERKPARPPRTSMSSEPRRMVRPAERG